MLAAVLWITSSKVSTQPRGLDMNLALKNPKFMTFIWPKIPIISFAIAVQMCWAHHFQAVTNAQGASRVGQGNAPSSLRHRQKGPKSILTEPETDPGWTSALWSLGGADWKTFPHHLFVVCKGPEIPTENYHKVLNYTSLPTKIKKSGIMPMRIWGNYSTAKRQGGTKSERRPGPATVILE